jgi:hypothetical protein
MRAAALVIRRRLATRWRAILVVGVLLGLGFGLSFASFAGARRTESAYDRILVDADAPDAASVSSAAVELVAPNGTVTPPPAATATPDATAISSAPAAAVSGAPAAPAAGPQPSQAK